MYLYTNIYIYNYIYIYIDKYVIDLDLGTHANHINQIDQSLGKNWINAEPSCPNISTPEMAVHLCNSKSL